MVQPIPSSEKFGNVEMTTGEAPKHTDYGHITCAYYLVQVGEDVELHCPHDHEATGGFYSEDYVQRLKVASQKLYTAIVAGNHHLKSTEKALLAELRDLTK